MKKVISKPKNDLETDWQNWVEARLKGKGKGQFPQADRLLEQRRMRDRYRLNYNVPFGLGENRISMKWPRRAKKPVNRKRK